MEQFRIEPRGPARPERAINFDGNAALELLNTRTGGVEGLQRASQSIDAKVKEQQRQEQALARDAEVARGRGAKTAIELAFSDVSDVDPDALITPESVQQELDLRSEAIHSSMAAVLERTSNPQARALLENEMAQTLPAMQVALQQRLKEFQRAGQERALASSVQNLHGVAGSIRDLPTVKQGLEQLVDSELGTEVLGSKKSDFVKSELAQIRRETIQEGLDNPETISDTVAEVFADPRSTAQEKRLVRSHFAAYVERELQPENIAALVSDDSLPQSERVTELRRMKNLLLDSTHGKRSVSQVRRNALEHRLSVAAGRMITNERGRLDNSHYVSGSIKSGGPLDERAVTAARFHGKQVVQLLQQPDIDDGVKADAIAQHVKTYGFLDTQVASSLSTLTHGSTRQVGLAVELVRTINAETQGRGLLGPGFNERGKLQRVEAALDPDLLAFARRVDVLTRSGEGLDEAIVVARESVNKVNPDSRANQYIENKYGDPETLRGYLLGNGYDEEDLTPELLADFGQLSATSFVRPFVGSIDDAYRDASNRLSRQWGRFHGRIMNMSPLLTARDPDDTWVSQQLDDTMVERFGVERKPDLDQLLLRPFRGRGADGREKWLYQVFVEDDDGSIDMMPKPVEFDYQQSAKAMRERMSSGLSDEPGAVGFGGFVGPSVRDAFMSATEDLPANEVQRIFNELQSRLKESTDSRSLAPGLLQEGDRARDRNDVSFTEEVELWLGDKLMRSAGFPGLSESSRQDIIGGDK